VSLKVEENWTLTKTGVKVETTITGFLSNPRKKRRTSDARILRKKNYTTTIDTITKMCFRGYTFGTEARVSWELL
jgi:hypothetical protein